MAKIDVVELELPYARNGTFGVAEGSRLVVVEPSLALGMIAADQATGFHFGDDGTTTAVVANIDVIINDAERSQYGHDLEAALREYEVGSQGRAVSEFCGFIDTHVATKMLLWGVEHALGKEPNTMQPRHSASEPQGRSVRSIVRGVRHSID